MADRKVIIAGGGIGGLTAALSLAKRGIASIVLERAPELGEIGAGIQLGPNAFRVFDELGVGKEARATAVYIERIRLMDAMTAEDIISIDLGEQFRKRFNNPYAVVHRGELHGVFVKACVEHPLVERKLSAVVRDREHVVHGGIDHLIAHPLRAVGEPRNHRPLEVARFEPDVVKFHIRHG